MQVYNVPSAFNSPNLHNRHRTCYRKPQTEYSRIAALLLLFPLFFGRGQRGKPVFSCEKRSRFTQKLLFVQLRTTDIQYITTNNQQSNAHTASFLHTPPLSAFLWKGVKGGNLSFLVKRKVSPLKKSFPFLITYRLLPHSVCTG